MAEAAAPPQLPCEADGRGVTFIVYRPVLRAPPCRPPARPSSKTTSTCLALTPRRWVVYYLRVTLDAFVGCGLVVARGGGGWGVGGLHAECVHVCSGWAGQWGSAWRLGAQDGERSKAAEKVGCHFNLAISAQCRLWGWSGCVCSMWFLKTVRWKYCSVLNLLCNQFSASCPETGTPPARRARPVHTLCRGNVPLKFELQSFFFYSIEPPPSSAEPHPALVSEQDHLHGLGREWKHMPGERLVPQVTVCPRWRVFALQVTKCRAQWGAGCVQ